MTITNQHYQERGVPSILLGNRFPQWKVWELRDHLEAYGVYSTGSATKMDLMLGASRLFERNHITTINELTRARERLRASAASGSRPLTTTLTDLIGGTLPSSTRRRLARQEARVAIQRQFRERFSIPIQEQNQQAQIDLTSDPPQRPRIQELLQQTPHSQTRLATSQPQPPDCCVCFTALESSTRCNDKVTASCNHETNICRNCLRQSIKSQFESKIWDQINCPSCNQRLTPDDINKHGDREMITR